MTTTGFASSTDGDASYDEVLPLAGVRVIELGVHVAAPAAGRLLAGYGADVIKVEAPTGDPSRRWGPFPDGAESVESSGAYLWLNTGKRSVTLNFATPEGRAIVHELAQTADLVIANHTPERMKRWGFTYDALSSSNERLSMVSISNYGLDGPYAEYRATDLTAFAMGGQMWMTGEPDREPVKNFGHQAEHQTAFHAFAASLALLLRARASGVGDHVDLSIQEALASILEVNGPNAFNYGTESFRHGNILRATWGVYPCKDGYVGIHILDRNLPEFFKALGREDLTATYLNPSKRAEDNDLLEAMVYSWCGDRTEREIFEAGVEAGAPIAYLPRVPELLDWPGLVEKGFWRYVDHPVVGTLPYPGPPTTVNGSGYRVSRPPLLGEHTDQVLTDVLGYDSERLSGLRAGGAL